MAVSPKCPFDDSSALGSCNEGVRALAVSAVGFWPTTLVVEVADEIAVESSVDAWEH
jgi:hypothetical protein